MKSLEVRDLTDWYRRNALDFSSWVCQFESRPEHGLSWRRYFVVFLSPSRGLIPSKSFKIYLSYHTTLYSTDTEKMFILYLSILLHAILNSLFISESVSNATIFPLPLSLKTQHVSALEIVIDFILNNVRGTWSLLTTSCTVFRHWRRRSDC
jgi:hypothetical protein